MMANYEIVEFTGRPKEAHGGHAPPPPLLYNYI